MKNSQPSGSRLRAAISVITIFALVIGFMPMIGADSGVYAAAKAKTYKLGAYSVTVNYDVNKVAKSVNITGTAKKKKGKNITFSKSVTVPAKLIVKVGSEKISLPIVSIKGLKTKSGKTLNLKNLPNLKKMTLSNGQKIVYASRDKFHLLLTANYTGTKNYSDISNPKYMWTSQEEYYDETSLISAQKGTKGLTVTKIQGTSQYHEYGFLPKKLGGIKVISAIIDARPNLRYLRIDSGYTEKSLSLKGVEKGTATDFLYRGYRLSLTYGEGQHFHDFMPSIMGQYAPVKEKKTKELLGFKIWENYLI